MNEHEARSVILVRALEESDPKGEILPHPERLAASRQAESICRPAAPSPNADALALGEPAEAFILKRSEILRVSVQERFPVVRTIFRRTSWPAAISWGAGLTAFLIGLLSNHIGPEKRINVLAFPLLGMLIWNLGVYGLISASALRRFLSRSSAASDETGPLVGIVARLGRRLGRSGVEQRGAREALLKGLNRFVVDWAAVSRRLQSARARYVLHISAALLAAGAVGGMYVRGMALEYLAGWESTFLDAKAVHGVLGFVLGPASLATGIRIPDESAIAAMRWTDVNAGRNAADWIHLYGATAGWVIVLPRLLLAALEVRKTRRLSSQIHFSDSTDGYFRRIAQMRAGDETLVRIVPYAVRIEPLAKEQLQMLGLELFGWNVQMDLSETVSYGAEENLAEIAKTERHERDVCWTPIFNLASTPEDENHGRLLEELKRIVSRAGTKARALVLVDEASYRSRFAGESAFEKRIEERRRLWMRFVEGHDLKAAMVDLTAPDLVSQSALIRAAISCSEDCGPGR